jgi:predicted SnoaL-like aldol condensation-catalyzing enzyme
MGRKLDNVVSLYLDGVRDRNLGAAIDKYVAADFVRHTTTGPADTECFYQDMDDIDAVEPWLSRSPYREVWPIRGFEDGENVFLHCFHSYGRGMVERVSMDVFRTNTDDMIIEQWNVTTPLVRMSSGHSQIDGAAHPHDVAETVANKRTVRIYLNELRQGRSQRANRCVSDSRYIEHTPVVTHVAAGFGAADMRVHLMVSHGDFVATASTGSLGASDAIAIDLFRLVGGRIVEHWGGVDVTAGRASRRYPLVIQGRLWLTDISR